MKPVVVRFAPSPSGFLHIGGARTALFNYLFAKKHNGKFLLRIEDSDQARSKSEYTEQIISSMRWLGLDYDGEAIFQSQRTSLYKTYAEKLIQSGRAYRCFCSRERIEQEKSKDQNWKYDRNCLKLDSEEISAKLDQSEDYVIRLKLPEKDIEFQDHVKGHMKFQTADFEDLIIMRSNGTPIYHLTVVVDDYEMGITHVIRGDDHLSNTPKQILISDALEIDVPEYAHIPLILGNDKKRLSKRHGATSVEEYQRLGILPEALLNFIALLGWSPGENREKLSLVELIEAFTLEGVSSSPAVFDFKKAEWLNSQYFSEKSLEELIPLFCEVYKKHDVDVSVDDKLKGVIELLKERIHNLDEFFTTGSYFYLEPEQYDRKGVRKYFQRPEAQNILADLIKLIEETSTFTEDALEQNLRIAAEKAETKAALYIHNLRLAITGLTVSRGIFETAVLIGKDKCLARTKKALDFVLTLQHK